MWIQHLLVFFGTILRIFFDEIGTTLLGRFLDIAFGLSIAAAAFGKVHWKNGWRAMIKNFAQEYKFPKRFTIWCALVIYGPLAVWSVGKAVYDDHLRLVGWYQKSQIKVSTGLSLLQSQKDVLGQQIADLNSKCARLDGSNVTLTAQNRDQQNLIAGCQNDAIKRLTPEPPKIIPLVLSEGMPDNVPSQRTTEYLLLTNHLISPVDLYVSCDVGFQVRLGGVQIVGNSQSMGAGSTPTKADLTSHHVTLNSPSWTPEAPLTYTIYYYGKLPAKCDFSERGFHEEGVRRRTKGAK